MLIESELVPFMGCEVVNVFFRVHKQLFLNIKQAEFLPTVASRYNVLPFEVVMNKPDVMVEPVGFRLFNLIYEPSHVVVTIETFEKKLHSDSFVDDL